MVKAGALPGPSWTEESMIFPGHELAPTTRAPYSIKGFGIEFGFQFYEHLKLLRIKYSIENVVTALCEKYKQHYDTPLRHSIYEIALWLRRNHHFKLLARSWETIFNQVDFYYLLLFSYWVIYQCKAEVFLFKMIPHLQWWHVAGLGHMSEKRDKVTNQMCQN